MAQPPERRDDVARLVRNACDERKDVTAFDVAWDLWQFFRVEGTVTASAPGDRTHAYAGAPRTPRPIRMLANSGYLAGYSDDLGVPLWAAYRVHDAEFEEAPPRPEEFSVDPRTSARVEPSDYTHSGFDRGHLAPSHVIALHHGKRAQEETFLMSNIVPQRHALNSGPWNDLERRIARNYPARFREVWVVVGPIIGERPARLRGRVAVPEAFFAVMIDEMEGGRLRSQAFVFPQDAPVHASPAGYRATIDEIERRTGLDLLHELPDPAEAELESTAASRLW